jgi:hypothetical protein
MSDATLAQGALVLPQPVEDILLVHASSYHKLRGKSSLDRGQVEKKNPGIAAGVLHC